METGPVVAVAYRRKDPGEIDAGTTAGKEQIVVELVLFGRGALQRRAFYREHDGRVVSGAEHEAAKPRLVVFPAKGKALRIAQKGAGVRRSTYRVDVPRGIEFVPVVFPGKLVGVGSHPCELCEGMPVCDVGAKDVGFDPFHWLALGVVDGPPASMLECLVGGWSVNGRRDCFQ